MRIKYLLIIIIIGVLFACQQRSSEEQNKQTSPTTESAQTKEDDLLKVGAEITGQLQQVLASQLQQAINDSSISYALQYCNLHAYPLTDSISNLNNVKIKRVTHKARNPKNKANKEEMAVIGSYLWGTLEEKEAEAQIKEHEDYFTYYAPIKMFSPLCLKCHGEPEKDIAPEDFIVINMIYPEDEATGFQLNELRGIWRVDFDKDRLVQ